MMRGEGIVYLEEKITRLKEQIPNPMGKKKKAGDL